MTKTGFINAAVTLLLLLDSPQSLAAKEILQPVPKPVPDITYRNKTYHFSFTIPTGWEKQSGNANSDNVLFMQMPISNSCSFQFNVTPMSASFPAEAAVSAALATAHHELKLNRLSSAKRRDTSLKEKIKEKGKEKEKVVILTRGWEITEKAQNQTQQRIIYQVYDKENRYFNFTATAIREKFATCAPDLRKIIDSISFNSL
jgi:hypothetical protein